jgi:hypothetical protein
MANNCPTR